MCVATYNRGWFEGKICILRHENDQNRVMALKIYFPCKMKNKMNNRSIPNKKKKKKKGESLGGTKLSCVEKWREKQVEIKRPLHSCGKAGTSLH